MGCRTGFYLPLAGDLTSKEMPLMIEMFEFIRDFNGEVPGASPKDHGNYLDMNLPMANYLAKRYLDNVVYNIDDSRLCLSGIKIQKLPVSGHSRHSFVNRIPLVI